MKMPISLLAALTVLGLTPLFTSCAAGPKMKLYYSEYAGAPVDDFIAWDINGWNVASNNSVVFWTGVNDAWLVRVEKPCRDLQFADTIGVTRTTNKVSRFEYVLVHEDRCRISEIRPVDIKRMRADRRLLANPHTYTP